MTALLIELLSLIACVILTAGVYGALVSQFKKAGNLAWHDYFCQCGIYQGVSHWTTVIKLLKKLRL